MQLCFRRYSSISCIRGNKVAHTKVQYLPRYREPESPNYMFTMVQYVIHKCLLSEPFLRHVSISGGGGGIRAETPKIAVFKEERLEKRLVRNAWSSATAHSADPSTKLGSSV
jgi:hypothetical protein